MISSPANHHSGKINPNQAVVYTKPSLLKDTKEDRAIVNYAKKNNYHINGWVCDDDSYKKLHHIINVAPTDKVIQKFIVYDLYTISDDPNTFCHYFNQIVKYIDVCFVKENMEISNADLLNIDSYKYYLFKELLISRNFLPVINQAPPQADFKQLPISDKQILEKKVMFEQDM